MASPCLQIPVIRVVLDFFPLDSHRLFCISYSSLHSFKRISERANDSARDNCGLFDTANES